MEQTKKVKTVGEGVGFEHIRRITGYLVGTTEHHFKDCSFFNCGSGNVSDTCLPVQDRCSYQ